MVYRIPEDEELPKPKLKTNRDALQSMDLYDMLCKMQDAIENNVTDRICILDLVGVMDTQSRCETRHWPFCKTCIADWLNEESDTG